MKTLLALLIFLLAFQFKAWAQATVTLKANQDVYFRKGKGYQSTNYDGSVEGLQFGSKTSKQNQYRNIINWDLSPVPKNVKIFSANLVIHLKKKVCAGGNCLAEDELDIFRLTSAWDESKVTWISRLAGTSWKTLGSDFDSALVASKHVNSIGNYEFEVTDLVQEWVDGTSPSYGLMGEIRNYDNTTVWVGGAHNGAWYPPCDLIIKYGNSTSLSVLPEKSGGFPVLTASPNPFTGTTLLKINFSPLMGKRLKLEIINLQGNIFESVQINSSEQNDSFVWQTRSMPAGAYVVRVGNASVSKQKKIFSVH